MRRLALLLLLPAIPAAAAPTPPASIPVPLRPAVRALAVAPALEPLRKLPWGAGERLTFSIRFAGIEGGRAALSVGSARSVKGRRTLKLRGLAESVPFFSAIRRMREEIVTQVDLAGLYPILHTSDRTLASRRRKIEVRYGERLLQTIDRDGKIFRRERAVAGPVYDGPSVLYSLRAAVLPGEGRFRLRVLGGPHLYQVEIRVVGREAVRALGKLQDALRLDGVAQEIEDSGKPARGERPRTFSIWIGSDARRLPLRAVGDTKLGAVEATLTSCAPARRPLLGRAPRLVEY